MHIYIYLKHFIYEIVTETPLYSHSFSWQSIRDFKSNCTDNSIILHPLCGFDPDSFPFTQDIHSCFFTIALNKSASHHLWLHSFWFWAAHSCQFPSPSPDCCLTTFLSPCNAHIHSLCQESLLFPWRWRLVFWLCHEAQKSLYRVQLSMHFSKWSFMAQALCLWD